MSIVIALKCKDAVILASDRQATYGPTKSHSMNKLFHSDYSNTAIGISGATRDANLIECNMVDLMDYKDILDKVKLDLKYVVNNIVTSLFEIANRYHRLIKDENNFDYEALVVSSENIFRIFSDGSVLEYDYFCCIGSGEQLGNGYLETIDKNSISNMDVDSAINYIKKTIKESCNNHIYVDDNVDFMIIRKKDDEVWQCTKNT